MKLGIDIAAIVATIGRLTQDRCMKTFAAREAKYNFGRLIDTARAEPVAIEKHGRPVVVVLAVEEFERLKQHREMRRVETPRKMRGTKMAALR
jgi:prevent-host-death family protein